MRTTATAGPFSTGPVCLGEPLGPDTVLPGGARVDAAQFTRADRVAVTVTASALAAATSITVAALAGPIPANKTITLTGNKLARTSAAVAAGATAIPVYALPQALAGTETGEYAGTGRVEIPVGTPLGRTIAERNAGTGFGPAVDTDDEVYLNAVHIKDASDIDDCDLYRHGKVVYENYLPGVAQMAAGLLTKLRGLYEMTLGA